MTSEGKCTRCTLTATLPRIEVGAQGECNYCKKWDVSWADIDLDERTEVVDAVLDR